MANYADKLLTEAADHLRSNRPAQAEQAYRRVLDMQPNNVEALRRLGILAIQAGHPLPAIELLQRAVRLAATPELCLQLANACRAAARFQDAVNVLKQGTEHW